MISRDIEEKIVPWLKQNKVIIIKGARQVGKTTILKNLQKQLEKEGNLVHYIAADLDFADPAFGDPRLFILRLDDLFGDKTGYVLIDEFQIIPNAGLFMKTVYDQRHEKYRFIVTGSSSLELTKNSEFLTGRKIEFIIRPFSFREFVRAKAADIPDRLLDPRDGHTIRTHADLYGKRLQELFAEYLRFGGYPESVLAPTSLRVTVLKELLSTYVRKDVAGFLRVENVGAFNNLVKVLSSQIGSQVNRSALANTLRINLETLNRYLDILVGTFVFHLVPPWFTNPRKEVSKMPKVYVTDPGFLLAADIAPVAVTPYALLNGHLVENAVWITLTNQLGIDSVRYWRSNAGAEIDFIANHNSTSCPIEVKFSLVKSHEPVAIRNFRHLYPGTGPAVFISKDQLEVPEKGSPFIFPAYLVDYLRWDTLFLNE